jgi:hypothetical protein
MTINKKGRRGWAPVAHACNLAAQEAEIRRIRVPSKPGQIVCETLP